VNEAFENYTLLRTLIRDAKPRRRANLLLRDPCLPPTKVGFLDTASSLREVQ
jgi:hypothetical protein